MLGKNKVQPVESPPPTEGEKMLEGIQDDESEEFDETLKLYSLDLAGQIEASFEPIQQKKQEQQSVEGEKEEVEGLTSISGKMTNITERSLKRITDHFKRHGIGHDENIFSKQIQELEQKLKSLEEEIREIKGEIEEKEQAQSEMSEQKRIIDLLINYNKLVRVNNKMKDEYDTLKGSVYSIYSNDLQPLFDEEQKKIGDIEGLTEVTLPEDETVRKKLYENMKTDQKLHSIDEKTKEITDKFTKLKLLIDKFNAYVKAENKLKDSFSNVMELKREIDEYKQKKAHIQEVKDQLKETLNLDEFEKYADALPERVINFMNEIRLIELLSQDAKINFEEATQKFNEAKSKLDGFDFVKEMETAIKNEVKYVGNLEDELVTIDDLKDEISRMLNDSVKRLIFTSFINGIQKYNLDYDKDENGKEYLIAYIYTLAYGLGKGTLPSLFETGPLEDISPKDKKKGNGIEALTFDGIKSLKVDDFPKESFPLTDLEVFVFDDLKLLESKHVAFLKNYQGDVTNRLLIEQFNSIVDGVARSSDVDYLANLPKDILPFYNEIIKTNAEREAEAAKRFTEDEFNYYLSKPPAQWNDLFTKMEDFKSRYTGEYGESTTKGQIIEVKTLLGKRILEFTKPYLEKKVLNQGQHPEKPGDGDKYITSDHFDSFKVFFTTSIPIPDDNVDFNGIIDMAEPLTHVVVLTRIIRNIDTILDIQDSNTLYNFKSWFFKENSIRSQREGTQAFEDTVWYKNHIEKLEIFLEHIIGKKVDHIIDNEGSYRMPLIDPTKFEDWDKSREECFTIKFLEYLLGEDFSRIIIEDSWKSKRGEDMNRENWDEEWMKKRLNKHSEPTIAADIPPSYVTRNAEEICSAFKRFINGSQFRDKYGEGKMSLKNAILRIFGENAAQRAGMSGEYRGQACVAVSSVFQQIMFDADEVNYCGRFDESQATGGSQKRRKDTRRKRKDTRRKRKDTRRKKKDTRRKRKDTRRKLRKDTRRKTRK